MTAQDIRSGFWHADGDPRDRFPDLVGILTEDRYRQWHELGLCLCGCGQPTSRRRPELPHRKEIAYWLRGHANQLRAQHGLAKGPTMETVRGRHRWNASRCVERNAHVVILSLVQDHIAEQHGGSVRRFCRAAGLDATALYDNLAGASRMTKRRAKVLLLAIGEKPHPSLG